MIGLDLGWDMEWVVYDFLSSHDDGSLMFGSDILFVSVRLVEH
jgi:hypothetical protein